MTNMSEQTPLAHLRKLIADLDGIASHVTDDDSWLSEQRVKTFDAISALLTDLGAAQPRNS